MEKRDAGKKQSDIRKQLRKAYLYGGIDDFSDIQKLAFLLSFSMPVEKARKSADVLVDMFGSVSAVFDASYEDLSGTDGISESTAALILLFHDLNRRYAQSDNQQNLRLSDTDALRQYISSFFIGETVEKLRIFTFDSSKKLNGCAEISSGSMDMAIVSTRDLMSHAVSQKAKYIILAHNHPAGTLRPSYGDIKLTQNTFKKFNVLGINLVDHIIVTDNGSYSMAESPEYQYIFRGDMR